MPCIAARIPSLPNRGMSAALKMLGMLDPPAGVRDLRMGFERLFVDIQDFAVGSVPMAWTQTWNPFSIAIRAVCFNSAISSVLSPVLDARVLIGFEEPRPPGAEGAVDEALDRPDRQMMVSVSVHLDLGRLFGSCLFPALSMA